MRELAAKLDNPLVLPCDVASDDQIAELAATLDREFGGLDFLVHGAAFAPAAALDNPFVADDARGLPNRARRERVLAGRADAGRAAADGAPRRRQHPDADVPRQQPRVHELQRHGCRQGGARVAVRYLASDLGPQKIRVNAISAGPIKTLAAAGISGFSSILQVYRERAPLRKNVELAEVADAALFLLGPASRAITGEMLIVDAGYHVVSGRFCSIQRRPRPCRAGRRGISVRTRWGWGPSASEKKKIG